MTYAEDRRMDGLPDTGLPFSRSERALPMKIMRAGDFGLSGYGPKDITDNAVLMQRIETIRLQADLRKVLG